MKIIAHRGLLNGPDSSLENNPQQAHKAINNGFGVELDIRYIDGLWFLGHDEPQYEISTQFIINYAQHCFFHAKNINALLHLSELDSSIRFDQCDTSELNYFFHDKDDCTLTSQGLLWTYPGKQLTKRSVAVMPETIKNWEGIANCYAVCTDYCFEFKESLKKD